MFQAIQYISSVSCIKLKKKTGHEENIFLFKIRYVVQISDQALKGY